MPRTTPGPLPTTTTGSTDQTNTISTSDVPVPYPADLPMNVLVIVLGYAGAIVAAIVLIELLRRRYG